MEEDVSRKRFRWALVLAWAPWIPILLGLWPTFASINNSKATGFGAVQAGMIEVLVAWGLGTLLIAQLVALIWLVRSFSKQDMFRNLISFVSICASGMMLLVVGSFLWLVHFMGHQSGLPGR